MSTPLITPSAALFIPHHTPIIEALRLMKYSAAHSFLITQKTKRGFEEIIGIFTEADLIKRGSFFFGETHGQRPIRTVMTKPVKFLYYKKMSTAAEFMIANNIRNAPILYDMNNPTKDNILGIINSWDLFKTQNILDEIKIKRSKKNTLRFGMITKNSRYITFLESAINEFGPAHITRFSIQDVIKNGQVSFPVHIDGLIFDVDHFSIDETLLLTKSAYQQRSSPPLMMIYDEALHPHRLNDIFKKLGTRSQLAAFTKPINPFDLYIFLYQLVVKEIAP